MNHDTTIPWWVKLTIGITLGVAAVTGISVDLWNAWLYGETTTTSLAVLAATAAGLVVVLPVAITLGAPRVLWLLQIACIGTTMYCAYQYYSTKQTASITNTAAIHEKYSSAAENKRLAREVLKQIKEGGNVEELGKLAANADANLADTVASIKKNCAGKREWTDSCTAAKSAKAKADTESTTLHTRLYDAKMRDAAQATLAKAEEKQEAGDAPVREADTGFLIWALLLVQGIASLGGIAAKMIAEALTSRPQKPRKASKPAREHPTDGGTKLSLGGNVYHLDAARGQVERWIDRRAIFGHGGELRGGEARKAFERYTGQKISTERLRELLTDILPAGSIALRNSGYVITGLSLRVEAEKKAAAR